MNPRKLGYWKEHMSEPSGFIKAKTFLASGVITN
jgi:hypothetical protein